MHELTDGVRILMEEQAVSALVGLQWTTSSMLFTWMPLISSCATSCLIREALVDGLVVKGDLVLKVWQEAFRKLFAADEEDPAFNITFMLRRECFECFYSGQLLSSTRTSTAW